MSKARLQGIWYGPMCINNPHLCSDCNVSLDPNTSTSVQSTRFVLWLPHVTWDTVIVPHECCPAWLVHELRIGGTNDAVTVVRTVAVMVKVKNDEPNTRGATQCPFK